MIDMLLQHQTVSPDFIDPSYHQVLALDPDEGVNGTVRYWGRGRGAAAARGAVRVSANSGRVVLVPGAEMPDLIYFRLAGNAATLTVHGFNSLLVLTALQDEMVLKDPEIITLASMQSRFLTIWNIAFQLAYASLAVVCDGLTVLNKENLLPKPIKKFRDVFFSSVVFPGTFMVFTFFWPVFLYDRSLIFPEFIDKAIAFSNNCVMHLAIVPLVMWELAFQPRAKPKTHLLNCGILAAYYIVYNIHVHVTYYERGLWPYPLLGMCYGTINYVYLQVFFCALVLLGYYVQWPLYTMLWGKEVIKKCK